MGMASRTSRLAIRARRVRIVSMVFSQMKAVTRFTLSDPLAERDQDAERDKHPKRQDDECNSVHGILLSYIQH